MRLKKRKTNIKEELSAAFEIPKEVALNVPLISLRGREEVVIENYRGIIEYITGEKMLIKCLDADNIVISGAINSTEFL